jgi:hypothetical protein
MKHRRFHPQQQNMPVPGRLSRRRELLVYAILGTLWVSGIGWLLFHTFVHATSAFGDVPHPLEVWWLRLHGAAAFASVWLFGMLWAIHVLPAWKARRRVSGIVLGVVASVLVLTGYLLYYGGESSRAVVSVLHWVLGLAALVPLLLHALRRRSVRGSP